MIEYAATRYRKRRGNESQQADAAQVGSVKHVANLALLLSIIAFFPSAGPFTPAIFLSALTALIAMVGVSSGYPRRGVITLYFAFSAAVVSPMALDLSGPCQWLVVLPMIGAVIGAILLLDFNRRSSGVSPG